MVKSLHNIGIKYIYVQNPAGTESIIFLGTY